MKRDLMQGLIAYPVPDFGGRPMNSQKRSRKFYQTINQIKQPGRLSRRLSANPKSPTAAPSKRLAVWRDLRRSKNV